MQLSTIFTTVTNQEADLTFVNSLDKVSRKLYAHAVPCFMKFCQIDSCDTMLQILVKQLESKIRDYLVFLRGQKVASATISLYLAVITHFYEMNDARLNWKRLNKFKGKLRNVI